MIPTDSPLYIRLRRGKILFELTLLTIFSVIIITLVHEFLLQPFITSGDSMVPTFASGEYLVIDELYYHFHEPQRGDVLIFRYPLDPSVFFIKRLIGVPGDTITDTDGAIVVHAAGSSTEQLLFEPYIASSTMGKKKEMSTTVLGADEYFVLGDNRNSSFDSRVWGPVPRRYIVGRPLVRIYPLTHFKILPGEWHETFAKITHVPLSTGK